MQDRSRLLDEYVVLEEPSVQYPPDPQIALLAVRMFPPEPQIAWVP